MNTTIQTTVSVTELLKDFTMNFSVFEIVTPTNNLTQQHNKQLLLYDVLIPVLGVLILVLNLAVVISSGLILKRGQQPRSTYLFLGNVAMCDFVTGFAVLFGQLFPKNYRDQTTCAFQLGLIVSSTLASIYSVGLIAIDRYLYIIHGLQYQQWIYPTRARICILFTWIIGCVIGFLPIMGWSGDTLNGKICWFIKLVPPNLILMTCLVGLLPIVLVVVLYSIILYHALKKVIQLRKSKTNSTPKDGNNLRMFSGTSTLSTSEEPEQIEKGNILKRIFTKKRVTLKAPSKTKAITVVLLVTGSFIITWVPYFAASFLYTVCDVKKTPAKCKNLQVLIASPLAILGFCNSLLNPLIYAWWHKGFRSSIKKICRKNKVNINNSSSTKSTNSRSSRNKTSIRSSVTQNIENVVVADESMQMQDVDLSGINVNVNTHM